MAISKVPGPRKAIKLEMKKELFYPAPQGLPVLVCPPRGDAATLRTIQETNWRKLANLPDDALVRAGALWLYAFLDEAHEIAQKNPSAEGSYWHALMHRSEGDFSNSIYWYGKVGPHAIFPGLRAEVEKMQKSTGSSVETLKPLLTEPTWNPRRFVDLCQQASQGRFTDQNLLQRVAATEYNLLMAYVLNQQAL